MSEQSYPIKIWNGILRDGHCQNIGNALWEFIWLIDKVTLEKNGIGHLDAQAFVDGHVQAKLQIFRKQEYTQKMSEENDARQEVSNLIKQFQTEPPSDIEAHRALASNMLKQHLEFSNQKNLQSFAKYLGTDAKIDEQWDKQYQQDVKDLLEAAQIETTPEGLNKITQSLLDLQGQPLS